jgi:FKBP-type peptidyl-prolyl cis-trans isomerase
LRSLKQYWQQAVARIRDALRPPPQHTSRPEELEHRISVVSSENQILSAELSRVRTDSERAQSEENLKLAALEQFREKTEAARHLDLTKLAELERLSDMLGNSLRTETQRTSELESRIDALKTELDQAREQNKTLESSLASNTTRLETTSNQVRDLQVLALEQAKAVKASLAQVAARCESMEEYTRSQGEKLENEQRLYANALQEVQLDQRKQDQRVSWTITVAGLALLLGALASGIMIWNVQKNSRVIASMSSDIKSLISPINEHLSSQHDFPGQELPPPAVAIETPVQTENASPVVSKTVEPVTTGKPDVSPPSPGSAFNLARRAKQKGLHRSTRQQAAAFFEENATESGIIEMPSGLQYRIVKAGSGKMPTLADKVVLDYLGATPDGTVFDSTYFTDDAATYSMSEVIPGWQEALLQMREGAEWELFVPPQLAQKGNIRKRGMTGFEPSVYLIELLQVIETND